MLKNKLTEEDIKKYCDEGKNCKVTCRSCLIDFLKKAGIIRKSAREELDEFIDNIAAVAFLECSEKFIPMSSKDYLKQLIEAALKEADERAEREEGR